MKRLDGYCPRRSARDYRSADSFLAQSGRQLPLSFPESMLDFEAMAQTPANARAFAAIRNVERWAQSRFFLTGSAKSGLTALAAAWAAERKGLYVDAGSNEDIAALTPDLLGNLALAIDNADQCVDEAWLLTMLSAAQRQDTYVLLTSHGPPSEWPIKIPDLRSRLLATPLVVLGPPDDALMRARLKRAASRFGLSLPKPVEDYLVVRLGLSYTAIEDTVRTLAGAAGGRHSLTVPLARAALEFGSGQGEDA